MHPLIVILLLIFIALGGCSTSDDNDIPQPSSCSVDGQKQFVLDTMNDVYFWNNLLPVNVDLSTYATAEELLAYLISFQPLDGFSYIDSAVADAQFFGEGQYEGYGFSTRFEAADDLRMIQVFADSPAGLAGFVRGDRVEMLNGLTIAEIEAGSGVSSYFSLPTLDFTLRHLDDSIETITVDQGLVTIDPIPRSRLIPTQSGIPVGYLELSTFISTADAEFDSIFESFRVAGVNDVIIDLRYNGGGLISTTELLGNYLGGEIADSLIFSQTLFNANNAGSNRIARFQDRLNAVSLMRLVVIATDRTASASELITNGMEPHANVSIVGGTTFGKPVGQLGIQFCGKILRPTAFETVNANGDGGYFGGLEVDCAAEDDLSIPIGDDADPNIMTALTLLETGACPPVTLGPPERLKPAFRDTARQRGTSQPPWRELAGAW